MSSAGDPTMSASTIVADTARGCHILKIDGYSHTKGIPTGQAIKSGQFTVGGHRWCIHYYPNGYSSDSADHVSFYLVLDEQLTKRVRVQLRIRFASLVTSKRLDPVSPSGNMWGYPKFIKREELERSEHLKNDAFTVRCDVVVINEIRTEVAATRSQFVVVPQSNLIHHLGDLLKSEKGADVVFEVGGVKFPAHRCVLAARSPVFSAELFGAMKEGDRDRGGGVRVGDMEARVFKALLSFVYTDSLPEIEEEDDQGAMFQHLLVAADRYDLGRLKLICEENLCAHIDVYSAPTMLAIAEQHGCHGLKKACIEFLSTPAHMVAAMLTSGDFSHLRRSCPAVWMELIRMSVAPVMTSLTSRNGTKRARVDAPGELVMRGS
ncbi:BTB/POZ and MATH domain-containing protein 3-like [Triticum urartu]|uniref:BTB/POZ and MATH domain-containing protein 3-like n=1 Tax=Triticum urartu TaxID=4572 RepID=UPI00204327EE|nr:BTB/POZ and MATH domain-containing protein 3-like [Triticum urartu]